MSGRRVAIIGFSIECNRFAPVATERDFAERTLLRGAAMAAAARRPDPPMLMETPGFVADMDAAGPWQPVPLVLAEAEPNGPVDHAFFTGLLDESVAGLTAAMPLDGVYVCCHGAALTTEDDDPDATLLAAVRAAVGPDIPVVATFDLHANVSAAMVDALDAFIGYRTNPHVDRRERGAEAAQTLRRLMDGTRTALAFVKLPIMAPSVTLLTARGPYAEMMAYAHAHAGPGIINVSPMGGFAWGDSSVNGLSVVVTAEKGAERAAYDLAVATANLGWDNRHRFASDFASVAEAAALARDLGADPSRPALCFADVADNPGGGARGNTVWLLRAFLDAGVEGALFGVQYDAPLAAEACRLGIGARFTARFNRDEASPYSEPFEAEAEVLAVGDGPVACRRGIIAGTSLDLGCRAALRISGLTVVVISIRSQCADPAFFECLGLDIGAARSLVVKSRGHFRAGFDEFFDDARIVEVDSPGLTSQVFSNFDWQGAPRPIVGLDSDVTWRPPAFERAVR